ncbi:hypothetical protein I8751_02690 [Nostocaceae cyanobacterium CENA357]|uniref:Uncharacterized protein n=1 Tax=Atlanticothrix silvestris CENA357 TaxID=1725252 RepID=A0A8J7H6N6_9CYAN|nr:hypothetical protein [Atlanticothrix silvestris]MBH8551307.1 hypothetical protein [Atlanticothrix silvestris CENA357]
MKNIIDIEQLTDWNTQEIKNKILELVAGRDIEPLRDKVKFYQNELSPYFGELSRRNPFPNVVEQLPIVIGVWIPIWSTIPFQDILPGRLHEQSYQIFHDNGYYANIARYAPGQSTFWRRFTSKLPAYDLMVMQKYAIEDNNWCIQNVGLFQALKNREKPLTIDDADEWFTAIAKSKFQEIAAEVDLRQELQLENMDRSTVKKFEKAYLATPVLKHLYIDHDFRLVKSQREAKQRPSYTITVRSR